ncbi:DUF6234 family protein [Streptomyces klenkii]
MEIWAAQGQEDRIEAARIAKLAWTQHFLIAALVLAGLVLAGLALLSRAPWTVLSQLLAAGATPGPVVFRPGLRSATMSAIHFPQVLRALTSRTLPRSWSVSAGW